MDDFLKQMEVLRKHGTVQEILRMNPGMEQHTDTVRDETREMRQIQGIIHAMTQAERVDCSSMTESRLKRVAEGSGTTPADVARFVADFYKMRILMWKSASMKA